ncbi:MAG: hypothetical protein V5A68_06600 [Candidatus Thermoplasmatota archaeon]
MEKKDFIITFIVIFCLLTISGCIEKKDDKKTGDDIDLSKINLLKDDILQSGFQKLNEEHITESYVVSEGKMFEGLLVEEKIEVYFLKSPAFIIQQSAELSSIEKGKTFLNRLKNTSTFPGEVNDWNFTTVSIKEIGDDSVLKQNKTTMEGEDTTINMLIFRINNIVNVIVTGSLPSDDIETYGTIVENRINQQISSSNIK